jgi:site-specific recombinase XerD
MDRPARSPLARSFERHMRAENRSERTITTYLFGLRQAETFLRERPDRARCADERERAALRPTTLEAATRADLEAFMADVLARGRAPSTAATYYKVLKVLYGWLVEEQELQADPMARMRPPLVPAKPVPIVPADGLKRLFAACAGAGFEARRDTALIMLLLDTGARREGALPFGRKAGEALDRYLRVRARHKDATLPWLWLGKKGQLTAWGLVQMLRRRGAQAGLPGLHPHQLRHTFAHEWLVQGGAETDLMQIAGWKSRTMLQRYGASAADTRAREAHRRFSPADRL